MKLKKHVPAFLLLVTPLFMANSPAPFAYPTQYSDYSVSDVSFNQGDSPYSSNLSFTLNNEGDGYISICDLYVYCNVEQYVSFSDEGYFSVQPLINPHSVAEINLVSSLSLEEIERLEIDEEDLTFSVLAYTHLRTDAVGFDMYSNMQKEIYDYDYELYYYSFTANGNYLDKNEKYEQSVIFTVKANEKEYSFFEYSVQSYHEFFLKEDVDPEDIDVIGMYTVNGRRNRSNNVLTGLGYFLIGLLIAFFVLTAGGIACAIIFPIMAIKKKNKRKKEAAKKVIENTSDNVE